MAQALVDAPDVDAYRLLVEQVIAGQGLSGVVRLLADMLGLPATITNEELEPLHAFAPRGKQLSAEETALPADVQPLVTFDIASEPQASTAPPTLAIGSTNGQEYVI